jgi:hypothetical protein
MFTTVIEIVKRSPGLTISRNAAIYVEYHPGLFQMLHGYWQGLYSSYRYILFLALWNKGLLLHSPRKCICYVQESPFT